MLELANACSKTPIRKFRAALISTSTGVRRSFFRNRPLSVSLDMSYQQVTDDTGQNPILSAFRSRVLGVGPQIGYSFPAGDLQGYLNLKAYGEFDQANRPAGWNAWLTFAISPAAPTAATPTRHLVTK